MSLLVKQQGKNGYDDYNYNSSSNLDNNNELLVKKSSSNEDLHAS